MLISCNSITINILPVFPRPIKNALLDLIQHYNIGFHFLKMKYFLLLIVIINGFNGHRAALVKQGEIKGICGRCLDVAGARTANRTPVQIFDCNGTGAQNWTIYNDGTIRALGKCLDVNNAAKTDGTPVQLFDCNGTGAQQWKITKTGSIINTNSNKCLAVERPARRNAVHVTICGCTGRQNQKWRTCPL